MGSTKRGSNNRKGVKNGFRPAPKAPEFTAEERERVESIVLATQGSKLAARILAEELVNAQRTTRANAGSTQGDLVKGSAAALRSILRALDDLGLLEAPKPKNPFVDLDGDEDPPAPTTPRPKKTSPKTLTDALGLDDA